MSLSRIQALRQLAAELQFDIDEPVRIGGQYQSMVEHGGLAYLSGQVPRIGTTLAVTGRAGSETSLEEAQRAARICVLRALTILHQNLGNLDRVGQVVKMNVYVQCDADFTQQSEVADGASAVLYTMFEPLGGHVRTAIGVQQLPKNASVELDLVVAVRD